ncbi:copper-binding protein [Noviherbaspirillum autotrophicum]|uniref:RND transporter n=1 Tax=Noviherbaspirillum autotrophicum TaxID=709839 RepID=A0A0C2BU85_9BURK|nr:hypothetical protein TSA66_13605 [Noviherbaspirillum autotrophicum]
MKTLNQFSFTAALVLSFAALPLANAADSMHDHDMGMHSMSTSMADGKMSEGEIKKVDKEAGKITIKHGELKNLLMPGMTMAFRVKDAAMLDQVKSGDKVSFAADKVGGQLVISKIELKK